MTRLRIILILASALFVSPSLASQHAGDVFDSGLAKPNTFELAKAGSKDDGLGTPKGQAQATKKALKQSKEKNLEVLSVQRGNKGYTVKILTKSGKVQQIWISD